MRGLSISKKFSGIALISVVLFILAGLICSWAVAEKTLSNYIRSEVKRRAETLNQGFADMEEAALNATEWFENSPRLAAAVLAGDRDSLIETGQLAMNSMGLDYFVVTDKQGNVLARAHEPEKYNDSISEQENIQKALQGERSVGVEEGSVVKFSIRAGTPLRDSSGEIIGAVSLGYVLSNDEFVDEQKKILGCDITVFHDNERIATTIVQNGERMVGTKIENQAILQQVLEKGETYYGEADILGTKYHAAYIPVKAVDGKVAGMLFLGQDAGIIEQLVYKLSAGIGIAMVISAVFLLLAVILAVRFIITERLKLFTAILKEVAEGRGDLTRRVKVRAQDEIGFLAVYFNAFMDNLQEMIKNIQVESGSSYELLSQASGDMLSLNSNIKAISDSVSEISAGYEETVASSEEVTATMHGILEESEMITERSVTGENTALNIVTHAYQMKQEFNTARDNSRNIISSSKEKLGKALDNSKSVEQINVLTDAILQIADQTNLLALNAAIEAARAGDAGRGFAVVAEEIRHLADSSKRTAREITDISKIITDSVHNLADSSDELMEYVEVNMDRDYEGMLRAADQYAGDAQAMSDIIRDFREVSERLKSSAGSVDQAMGEVAASTTQGADEVMVITDRSGKTAVSSEGVVRGIDAAKISSTNLKTMVSQFKV